jgi:hypothetical protein
LKKPWPPATCHEALQYNFRSSIFKSQGKKTRIIMERNSVFEIQEKMMPMTISTKKWTRLVPRSSAPIAIRCRPFAINGALHVSDAVILNFSRKGMYIETSRAFKPGTILIIRKANRSPWISTTEDRKIKLPSLCLAEVKWLKERAQEDSSRFGMGLVFL